MFGKGPDPLTCLLPDSRILTPSLAHLGLGEAQGKTRGSGKVLGPGSSRIPASSALHTAGGQFTQPLPLTSSSAPVGGGGGIGNGRLPSGCKDQSKPANGWEMRDNCSPRRKAEVQVLLPDVRGEGDTERYWGGGGVMAKAWPAPRLSTRLTGCVLQNLTPFPQAPPLPRACRGHPCTPSHP